MSTSLDPAVAVRHTLRQSVFGWDMFISYGRRNRQYAEGLADELRQKGFHVFLDNFNLSAGTNIDGYMKGARRSRMLILVGTPDVLDSKHVPREIEAYCSRRRRLRLVGISIDRALAEFESPVCPPQYAETPWKALCEVVHEDEKGSALESGKPSRSVVDRIERSFDVLRSETLLLALSSDRRN
jgi:hypothetical protein